MKKIEKDTEKNPGRPGIYRFAIACLVFQACFLSFISAPGINAMAVHGGNIAYAEDFNYSHSNHGYEMNVPGENDSEENDSYGYSVISGIVEENNPILGYIAIYNPSLPVQGMQAAGREEMLQVLNYLDPDIDVRKITRRQQHKALKGYGVYKAGQGWLCRLNKQCQQLYRKEMQCCINQKIP